jgi:hypothetical protein
MGRQVRELDERRPAHGLEQRRRDRLLAAGHRRKKDDRGALANGRVEPL